MIRAGQRVRVSDADVAAQVPQRVRLTRIISSLRTV
jgi:hypothetical protein